MSSSSSSSSSLSASDLCKRAAARACVDVHVLSSSSSASPLLIGIGSGSTIVFAIERIAEKVKSDKNLHVICVPTGFQSRSCLLSHSLPVSDLDAHPLLDFAIDGADECDSEMNCIKGGGGCQTREKCVASAAKRFYVIADGSKLSSSLGSQWRQGIPVEVMEFAWRLVQEKLSKLGYKSELRMAKRKAGPVVTDNGHLILDVFHDPLQPSEVSSLNQQISLIPGVVETGLFVKMADIGYFGMGGEEVKIVEAKK